MATKTLINNAIVIYRIDREDYWLTGPRIVLTFPEAIEIPVTPHEEKLFTALKAKLEKQEVIDHIIEKCCLDSDLFDGDESYKFNRIEHNSDYSVAGSLSYIFKNDEEDELTATFEIERVSVL
jgi:hypothetical protein